MTTTGLLSADTTLCDAGHERTGAAGGGVGLVGDEQEHVINSVRQTQTLREMALKIADFRLQISDELALPATGALKPRDFK